MTAFSKTILGKILGGSAQVIATPLGLGNVAHAAIDKVSDGAQNVITGRTRQNINKDINTQQEAASAQSKVTQVGLNVQTGGGGGTSVAGYLNTGAPTASGSIQGLFYWIQNNVMVLLGIVVIYFILRKKKSR